MGLEELIASAAEQGASDVHLEPGLPAALRVRGQLKMGGESVDSTTLLSWARQVIPEEEWPAFVDRRSWDLSRVIRGVRCRINVLHSARGVGMAIRLLSSATVTLRRLNLHPDLKKLIQQPHGLILVAGPTGSGKTSTLAALIQEVNTAEARHIVTIESPIEYAFRPVQSFIRQREVGRDTPSFQQALLDAMREDPDVLMVGEMRDPDTMQMTLQASETGHLVLATVHSSSCGEALQRVVGAFPPEIQSSVCAQLADCLVGVVCQRLKWRPEQKMRVPELEVLVATSGVKAVVRAGQFFKVATAIESGGADGMFSFARYREWLDRKTDWSIPDEREATTDLIAAPVLAPAVPPPSTLAAKDVPPSAKYRKVTEGIPSKPAPAAAKPQRAEPAAKGTSDAPVFELDEVADNPLDVLQELEKKARR